MTAIDPNSRSNSSSFVGLLSPDFKLQEDLYDKIGCIVTKSLCDSTPYRRVKDVIEEWTFRDGVQIENLCQEILNELSIRLIELLASPKDKLVIIVI